ncbi:hypothetical protein ACTGZQ_11075 [Streptococcus suis]
MPPLEVDLVALAQKHGINRFTNDSLWASPEGYYLRLDTANSGGEEYLYNIDTEELVKAADSSIQFPVNEAQNKANDAIREADIGSTIGQRFDFSVWDNSLSGGEDSLALLSGTNFLKEEPELAKILTEGQGELWVREEGYDPEEWINTLLHWFAPEGQEVLEVYASDHKTGERTVVRSYAEYEAWAQEHLPDE